MFEDVVKQTLLCLMYISVFQTGCESVTGNLCSTYPQIEKCCKGRLEHAVSEFSVNVSYSIEKIVNDTDNPWRLDAHVTWDPPNFEDNFQYAVNINFTISPEDVTKGDIADPQQGICLYSLTFNYYSGYPPRTCSLSSEETWYIVNGTSFDATDLYFGFQYRFLIRTFENGIPSANLTCMYKEQFYTPDCYAKTGDEDFCRTRVTIISSAPVNLTITSIFHEEDIFGTLTLSLSFEWQDPLQVNGQITSYRAYLTNWNGSEDVGTPKQELIRFQQSMPSNSSNIEDFRYRALFSGYVQNEPLLHIVVYPMVLVNAETFREISNSKRGTPAEMVFDPDDFSLVTTEDTFTKSSTTTPQIMVEIGSPPSSNPEISMGTLLLISGLLLLVVSLVIVFVSLCLLGIRKLFGKTNVRPENNQVFLPFHEMHSKSLDESSLVEPIFRGKEIFNYSHIKEQEIIGNGQFGVVIKGRALLSGKESWVDVAIKKPKQASASEEILENFKNEIRLMMELGTHPHIISVLGCCTIEQPYYLITDFMEYGDLLHFLQKCYDVQNNPPDPIYKVETVQQGQISHQIASGMSYVAGTRFFHGDLAARNILVGKDLWVKITDFGLTDDLYQKGYTRLNANKRRPYKWYGPEAIERQYCTLKTDIWSYGILLWEIFTFGRETPYHGMAVKEVLYRLKRGYRLPQPPGCPTTMYGLMQACWENDPDCRPSFGEILECLEYILINMGDQTNYILASSDDISADDSSTESGNNTLFNWITSLEADFDNVSAKDYNSNPAFSNQSFQSDSDYVTTNESFVMEPILDEVFYDDESAGEG